MATPFRPTILNVDDHPASRYLRTRTLDRAGFRVLEASTGLETLELVASAAPDLVLLDVNLPDMSGFDVCRQIKANPATASVPVLHISASSIAVRDKAHGLEGGADGYVVEPVEPEELVANIRALLRVSQAERFSQALNRVHQAIGSTLDFDEIMRRVVVEANQALRTETAAVAIREHGFWTVRYAHGLEGIAGYKFPDLSAVPSAIAFDLRQGGPVVVEDAQTDPRVDPRAAREFGFRSMLFVPLVVRQELIGILSFHHHSDAIAFTETQLDFTAKLGTAISLALENARLYAEAEEGRKVLEALMENIPDGIAIADAPDVKIRLVSRYGRDLIARPREEIEGCALPQNIGPPYIFHADGLTPAGLEELPLIRAIRDGEIVRNEEWVLEAAAGGPKVPLLCNAGPIRDSSGEISGGVVAFRDISSLKRLEAQLLQAQKMEAVGMLAGGLAHEFNNMLMVITGHSQMLLEQLRGRKHLRQNLETILRSANRLSALTSELLAFAGRQMIQPSVLDLNSVVRHVQPALRQIVGEQIQLTIALDPGLDRVKADAGQLGQTVLSLAIYGRHVMPQGGRLAIETANVGLAQGGLSEQLGLGAGDYVMLAVSDTGPALDDEARRRLFEPFFGEPAAGRPGGMGLSTVYGIARQNRGGVRVVSGPGRGNRVEIYLPRAIEESPSGRPDR